MSSSLLPDGIQTITLKNKNGLTLDVSTLGGIVRALRVPDKNGQLGDVVLGYPDVKQHHDNGYMNALIGRVGNRISKGGFMLDGRFCSIESNSTANKAPCSLHGGPFGFDQKIWRARTFDSALGPALELTTFSDDGESGYPGNLAVRVVYTLTQDNAWRIDYWAVTDRTTVVNLTNHSYFNLTDGTEDITHHDLKVNASRFTEVDGGLIPTGCVLPVDGTSLDFRKTASLAPRLAKNDSLYDLVGGGLDHNFFLDRTAPGLFEAATLSDPASGRVMKVFTTEPCMQIYTANYISDTIIGKQGHPYGRHWGICFETQHAQDAPNQVGFPPIRLDPGDVYHTTTVYAFSTL